VAGSALCEDKSVADSKLRELGTIVPGARLAEPGAPVLPVPPANRKVEPKTAAPSETIFAADLPEGIDAFGLDAPLGLLAELAAHKRTETPLTIGLFGPPGSGKSFALTKLVQSIEDLSQAATALASPYTPDIVSVHVDATEISGNPATALAGALYARLARTYPALAAEATRAARDPRAAASEALERLDLGRRKLEAEKRALDETTTRRARLSETILYETAGSQVDAHVSANRSRIKSLLARLGIAGDPLLAFKDLVGGTDGAARRTGFTLLAFFAFKGQRNLLVVAILLFLGGVGLRIAVDQQTAWLGWLRATDSSVPIANWFEAHMDLLSDFRGVLFLGAALALSINVWRAVQLLRLVFRGADLLHADLTVRRRDTNDLLAFQARRVEALAAELNSLSRRAAEAERRAGEVHAGSVTLAEPAPFAVDTAIEQARTFASAAGAMVVKPGQTSGNKSIGVPRRIVFAIDHLDAVPASRGRDILAHARSLFKQGFVLLAATDPARLAAGAGESAPALDKWIQVPFQLGELTSRANYARLVSQILGGKAAAVQPGRDATKSVLDQPISPAEARLLGDLAPLAGSSARSLKRFVNLYRLARAQDQLHKGALAFLLALDVGGSPAEITEVNDALARANPEEEFDFRHCSARITEALAAAQSAFGKVHVAGARRAAAAARLFSFHDHALSGSPAARAYL
jgi:hypothetical protein